MYLRRGADTSNLLRLYDAGIYPRASPPRGSTHTQHVAIPEPTTIKYLRATDCTRSYTLESCLDTRVVHVGGQFIVAGSESFVLARIGNAERIDPAVSHVFVWQEISKIFMTNDRII